MVNTSWILNVIKVIWVLPLSRVLKCLYCTYPSNISGIQTWVSTTQDLGRFGNYHHGNPIWSTIVLDCPMKISVWSLIFHDLLLTMVTRFSSINIDIYIIYICVYIYICIYIYTLRMGSRPHKVKRNVLCAVPHGTSLSFAVRRTLY